MGYQSNNIWQLRFPISMHADSTAFVLIKDRPFKSEKGREVSNPCPLSFLLYRALNYLYTAQSWSTLTTYGFSLFYFNISLFYMLFTFAVAVAVVGEDILLFTLVVL